MQLKFIFSLMALAALCMPAFGQTTAADWFEDGNALLNQGKYNEAIIAYDEAIRLDLKYAAAWSNKGSALLMQRKYDEAIKAYDEAIKLNSSEPVYWDSKGYALYVQGKYDEAIEAYDEAIKLDLNYSPAWNGKGNAFAELGKYNESIQAYDEAIRLDPTYVDALNNRAKALASIPYVESPAGKHSCQIGTPGLNEFVINWTDNKNYTSVEKNVYDGTTSYVGSSETWLETTFDLDAHINKNDTLSIEIGWHPGKKDPTDIQNMKLDPEKPAIRSDITIQGKKALFVKYKEQKIYRGTNTQPITTTAHFYVYYQPDDYTDVRISAPVDEWTESEFKNAMSSLKVIPPAGYY